MTARGRDFPIFVSLGRRIAIEKRMRWVLKERRRRTPWLDIQESLAKDGIEISIRSLQRYVKKAAE